MALVPPLLFFSHNHLKQDLNALIPLTQELREYNKIHRPTINCKKGDLVCALFSSDQQWYRGKVLSLTPTTCEILFIDYGSIEHCSRSTIRSIHTFGKLQAQALECEFAFIQPEKVFINGTIRVGILQKKEGIAQVLVYYKDDTLINLQLVQDGNAVMKKCVLPLVQKVECISSVLYKIHQAQETAKMSRVTHYFMI